ncbi:MAG: transcriptional regulator [Candidatus Korobacteraceae bacterium]
MSTQPRPKLLRFGVFEADPASGELRKQGRRIRLAAQPFEILLLLLERQGEVVSREEIRQRLWPEGTFVDFEHSLNAAVAKLRDALGDSAASPRFVETVARRGYRFIAPVDSGTVNITLAPTANLEPAPASSLPGTPKHGSPLEAAVLPQEPDLGRQTSGKRFAAGIRLDELLTRPEEVPHHASLARTLFLLAQLLYLGFYIAALAFPGDVTDLLIAASGRLLPAAIVLLTAAIGVPIRLYLISGTVFRAMGLRDRFLRLLFPVILILDLLWAASPFFLSQSIGFGLALAATAALAYLPFAQRTLVLMGALGAEYPSRSS